MARKYRNYTDQEFIDICKKVKSIAGLLKGLGLVTAGGNYGQAKLNLQRLNIDTSHWTGQAWSKGQRLKDWSQYAKSEHIKPHLIKERGHKCECCKLNEWIDKPITLELEHIDGDRCNNEKNNLKLLCPNCHSQTSTWRRCKKE